MPPSKRSDPPRRGAAHHLAALVALATVAVAACTDDGRGTGGSTSATSSAGDGSTTTGPEDAILDEALSCDPLDERACLLPWPNDAFTVPDASTRTGRRLDIQPDTTPANTAGVHIDPSDQNLADGFSPGSTVLALVPGLDIAATGIAPSTDIGASLHDDAPVVLLDTTSGERLPHWGELDAQAPAGDQLLQIHPATSLPEGHHVVVALRAMRDADGAVIPRTTAFQAAIDGEPEPLERARALREMLATLEDHGVAADDLFVAWEFTVASANSLSGRLLHMREQAYAALADGAPRFTVTAQADNGGVRTIDGTFEVSNFLTGDGAPGSTFLLGADGLPQRNSSAPTFLAEFRCVVPLAPPAPVPAIVYGHGLLGTRREVDNLSFAAASGLAAACATDQIGMSSADVGTLATILGDLSMFHQQADRMQQGLLNQQFLGRLLNHADGFASSPAFHDPGGVPVLATGRTQFVGNSQGGVLGGAASAVSSEWSRVVLGVPGINYSLLLPRSSDWPRFQQIFDQAYTDPVDRVLALQLMQLLWDRGENNGYAQHLTTDPYPGIAPKQVLLVQAFGDHQVANVATEVLARTIGAAVHSPALRQGRSADVQPQWGLQPYDADAPPAAVLVVWDFGTPAPPTVNLPPTDPEYGTDPHGAGSREPRVLQQALAFLLTGELLDVCDGGACTSDVLVLAAA